MLAEGRHLGILQLHLSGGEPLHRRDLKLGWPLTLNVVLHRENNDRVSQILDLANTQCQGWALRSRGALPRRDQLERAETVVRAARYRLKDRMEVINVLPDCFSGYPKPCLGGSGHRMLTVVQPRSLTARPAAGPSGTYRIPRLSWRTSCRGL